MSYSHAIRIPTLISALASLLCVTTPALATTVNWAGAVSNSNVPTAPAVLDEPDGEIAGFFDGDPGTILSAEYDGFGAVDIGDYDSVSLAMLLGVSDVVLAQADVIAFEINGSAGFGFEASDWLFQDGTTSLLVSHLGGVSASGAIIAIGIIDPADYASFFGFPNPFGGGEIIYIMFDVDGNSLVDPSAASFSVTLSAIGDLNTNSPDPDALGVIPEPSVTVLACAGLVGLAVLFRTRRRAIEAAALARTRLVLRPSFPQSSPRSAASSA